MAPHSSTLAWKISWTEEPGWLQSMGLLKVRHDWATSLSLFIFMHWRRKWQSTPVFLPGESQGRGEPGGLPSMGSHRVGHDWSDLAAAAAAATFIIMWQDPVAIMLFTSQNNLCSSPQPFGHQGLLLWKTVFPRTQVGWWFPDDSSTLHLLCTLVLLLLHQLHLRSSGIRSQRLGTPDMVLVSSLYAFCTWENCLRKTPKSTAELECEPQVL